MEFRLLGPLEVVDGGHPIPVAAGRQRAILTLLLLRANQAVSSDLLVTQLWGESPPATAQQMVHNAVSALRRQLGRNGRLETAGNGYRLNVAPGELDLDRFDELLERGRIAEDPEEAAAQLRAALALWRGPPLADVTYDEFAQAQIARLEERRLVAFEQWVDAQLALGQHADLVAELESAVADNPLRERLHRQLMLALYRSGRQAEALESYRRARQTLVEQLGIEPGPELKSLQAAILAQDPSLDAPPAPEGLPAELEAGSPLLAGREEEIALLRDELDRARGGSGGLVLISGPHGIGKTRLAAELAISARRARMAVGYAGATSAPATASAAIERIATAQRPALLVLDDADDASPALLTQGADLARDAPDRALLVLVLHRGLTRPPAFAQLASDARLLQLAPIDESAAEQIAGLYASITAGSIPVQTLMAQSGGVPLAVHRAASEWARAEAAQRLVATAGRAAVGRSGLREAEAALAGNVIDLQAARERGRLYPVADDEPLGQPAVCPFRGLAPFDAAHAEYFFGRERLVAELVARLVGAPLLAVVGPSGSGKSSAVRAGLLPSLASGVLPGSEHWRQAVLRPGERPLQALRRAIERSVPGLPAGEEPVSGVLAALGPDERMVLLVDQFEEVFTACRDDDERRGFLDAVIELAHDPDARVPVVLALRADFYGRCASHPALADLVGANQVLVGAMRRDELRRAIELPARHAGLHVEARLIDALIADVADEPGGLPLLSTALLELWEQREGRALRHAAYERTGGVSGAVARLAETAYDQLTEPQRARARTILVRLADAGAETEAFVRRRVSLDELDVARDEHAAAALAALTDSRLLTVDEDAVEVAHEALLREWPRLRGWLEEDAEGRRLHQHLIHAAHDWQTAGREPGELYRGARLASALDWATQREQDLNELERTFLAESRTRSEFEAERQRRANRRLRVLLAGVGAMLALAVIAGVVALSQRGEARRSAVVADAQRLGAEALTDDRLDHGLLLARAGVALDDSIPTRSNLLAALLRNPAALGVMRGDGDRLLSTALSPDGKTLAVGDNDGTVRFFDAAGRRRLDPPYQLPEGGIFEVGYSPDGSKLSVAGGRQDGSFVDVVDARTHKLIAHMPPGPPEKPNLAYAASAQFAADSRSLVIAYAVDGPPDMELPPAIVRRVDARTGEPVRKSVRIASLAPAPILLATADRRRLFLSSERDRATYELDARTLRVVKRHRFGGFTPAISNDGRLLALGGEDGSVRVVDLASRDERKLTGRHEAGVLSAVFAPGAKTLVTTGDDGKVIVWDLDREEIREVLTGHTGRVRSAAISSNARTLFTAALDSTVIAWDLGGDRRLGRPFVGSAGNRGPEQFPPPLAVSNDGRVLVMGQTDGSVAVLDPRSLRRTARLRAISDGFVAGVAVGADSRTVAVTGKAGSVTLWDRVTQRRVAALRGLRADAVALGFSPDGKLLAAGDIEGNVRVWNVARRAQVGSFKQPRPIDRLAFSADGQHLAVTSTDLGVEVRDVRGRRRIARLPAQDAAVWSVGFSPDGRLVATSQDDGRALLWSTKSWRRVGRPLAGHAGFVLTVSFSPDSRTLATSSTDGTIQLWDVASQRPLGTALPGAENRWVSAAFTPDGSRLFAFYDSGIALRWEISPAAWKRHACFVAGRDLTRDEWREALPEQPYRRLCAG